MNIMLCKEEVCSWFRTLSADKRIDLMCGLLHMCLPLELRFIGSCVEDLAKQNFHYLREAELKANDKHEWSKSTDLSDPVIRSRVNIYTTLLYSANRLCSGILFRTLTEMNVTALLGLPTGLNATVGQELLLLLTLATNHPAFDFNQKQIVCELLQTVARIIGDNIVKPVCMRNLHIKPEERHHSSPEPHVHTESPNSKKKVFIESIDLKRSHWRSVDRRHEFHLKVTWSDGRVEDCVKTYHELQTFHQELIRLFPKDSGAHKQDRHIPFLPQDRGHSHGSELCEQIKRYLKQLSGSPEHIVQCDHVSTFFTLPVNSNTPASHSVQSNTQSSPRAAAAANAAPANVTTCSSHKAVHAPLSVSAVDEEDPITATGHVKSLTIYNSHIDKDVKKVAGNNNNSTKSPRHNTSQNATTTNRQAVSQVRHGSSPSMSPVSSPLTLTHTTPSSPAPSYVSSSPITPMTKWLREIRLHKYTPQLSKFTFQELTRLNDSELKKLGLTDGARKKLHNQIDFMNQHPRPNGLINDLPAACSLSPSSPSSSSTLYHSPPSSLSPSHPSPIPGKHPAIPSLYGQPASSITSSVDSSYSDSSPPLSPEPDASQPGPDVFLEDPDMVEQTKLQPGPDMTASSEFVPIPVLNSAPTLVPYRANIPPVIPGYSVPEASMPVPIPGVQPHGYGPVAAALRSPRPHANHHADVNANKATVPSIPYMYDAIVKPGSSLVPQEVSTVVVSSSTSVVKTLNITTVVDTSETVNLKAVNYSNQIQQHPRPASLNVTDSSSSSSLTQQQINAQMNSSNTLASSTAHNNAAQSVSMATPPPPLPAHVVDSANVTNGQVLHPNAKREVLCASPARNPVYPATHAAIVVPAHQGVIPPAQQEGSFMNTGREGVFPAVAAVSRENVYPSHPVSPTPPRENVMSPPAPPVRDGMYPVQVGRDSSCDGRFPTPPPPQPSSQTAGVAVMPGGFPQQPHASSALYQSSQAGYGSVYTVTQPNTSITYTVPSSYSSAAGGGGPQPPCAVSNLSTGGSTMPTCTTCGCRCKASVAPSSTTSNPVVASPLQFSYGMWPNPMFPGFPHSIIPPNSNGLISTSLNYPSPVALNLHNGLATELLYASHGGSFPGLIQQQILAQHQNQAFLQASHYNNHNAYHSANLPAQMYKHKSQCYNCGMQGHRASECKEPSMEYITHQGQFHLNITPKSDSD